MILAAIVFGLWLVASLASGSLRTAESRRKMARDGAIVLAVIAAIVVVSSLVGVAHADPGPPTPGPGFAQCGDQLVPLDPRVSTRDPWGTLMYEQFLRAFCGPTT